MGQTYKKDPRENDFFNKYKKTIKPKKEEKHHKEKFYDDEEDDNWQFKAKTLKEVIED